MAWGWACYHLALQIASCCPQRKIVLGGLSDLCHYRTEGHTCSSTHPFQPVVSQELQGALGVWFLSPVPGQKGLCLPQVPPGILDVPELLALEVVPGFSPIPSDCLLPIFPRVWSPISPSVPTSLTDSSCHV